MGDKVNMAKELADMKDKVSGAAGGYQGLKNRAIAAEADKVALKGEIACVGDQTSQGEARNVAVHLSLSRFIGHSTLARRLAFLIKNKQNKRTQIISLSALINIQIANTSPDVPFGFSPSIVSFLSFFFISIFGHQFNKQCRWMHERYLNAIIEG